MLWIIFRTIQSSFVYCTKKGNIKAFGRNLVKAAHSLKIDISNKIDIHDIWANDDSDGIEFEEIEPKEWYINSIDWEKSYLISSNKTAFCHILVDVESLFAAFPASEQQTKSVISVNGVFLDSNQHISNKTKTGRPSYNWHSFHEEMAYRLLKGELPKLQKTCVIEMGDDLKAMPVILPNLPEQEKIANFLTAIDDLLAKLQEKKSLLAEYKTGVMQQIFEQKIRFTDDHGNQYPDWEEKKLGDFCSFFSGGTPLTTQKDFYNGDIPFIKSGEINSEKTKEFISEKGLKNSSAKKINKGDLLFALYGATSGEVGISKLDGAINQAVLCIKTNGDSRIIYHYLKYKKDSIIATFLQGGQGNLSTDIVKNLKINLPSLPEQQKIANFLTAIDAKIEAVAGQIEQAQTYKKALLQQMFV